MTISLPAAAAPRRVFDRLPGRLLGPMAPDAIAWTATAFMLVLLPVTLTLLQIDPRSLHGVSVWAKPVKFQLSLALHFATLAWLAGSLTPAAQERAALRLSFLAAAMAGVLELLYILLQAGRGRASHFNIETPLEAWLYNAMGVGAVLIVMAAMQLGLMIRRHPRPGIGAGLRTGAVLGLVLGGLATLVTAGLLGSGQIAGLGHWVGGIRDDASGLALVGWSRSGGDLRVPHFFATHLMQALPLLGLALDRWAARRAAASIPGPIPGPIPGRSFGAAAGWVTTAVRIAALLGLALVVATFCQALRGQPFPGF